MKKLSLETKVGLFAALAIAVIVYATLEVSERGVFTGGDYRVTVLIESAQGLTKKTPVEVAGVQVGYIEDLELYQGRYAKAKLRISKEVKLGKDAVAQVRTKGFLGETYVDLNPGHPESGLIPEGGQITATNPYVDLGQIAADVREITRSLKDMVANEEKSPVYRILKNMEAFTERMSEISTQNQENVNQIMEHLKEFTANLDQLVAEKKETLSETMDRIDRITRHVEEGKGTIGRLLNDEETAQSINDAAKGISETLGGVNRFQIEFGYHLEYLAATKDFKNYAGLAFRPRPDKAFLIEFVGDPAPSPNRTSTDTTVTTGGTTTTITTEKNIAERDKFLVSAELAKTFYNFTLRGGLIESRGGLGVDYGIGPFGIQFSAFDFRTDAGQRPHLKAMGVANITKNFFFVSGLDDFINKQQSLDWFVGGGLRLVDNDIKSLLGAASLK